MINRNLQKKEQRKNLQNRGKMKLIVQSDDYGITRGAAQGCLHGIKNGVITQTGMFANMPWIEECVEWIKPYLDQISFGIDLNASTGPSVLGHDKVPTLTKENGDFYGSRENRAFDTEENGFDHLAEHRDELYAEFKAQIEKYIDLVGHKPDFIHNHAYGTKTTDEVTRTLAREYGILCTVGAMDHKDQLKEAGMGWYAWGDPAKQLESDPISYITQDKGELLNYEYGYIISHCGYADSDLFKLTSLNAARTKDLEAMTSDQVKSWIKTNNIELISFKNLPKEWI